jgi:hypothetical protein
VKSSERGWPKLQTAFRKEARVKPTMDNGFGGKEYEIDKKRIRPPRAPVKLSAETRAKLAGRLRQSRAPVPQNAKLQAKSDKKNQKVTNTIKQHLRTVK